MCGVGVDSHDKAAVLQLEEARSMAEHAAALAEAADAAVMDAQQVGGCFFCEKGGRGVCIK
jgi:hypothetical protein